MKMEYEVTEVEMRVRSGRCEQRKVTRKYRGRSCVSTRTTSWRPC